MLGPDKSIDIETGTTDPSIETLQMFEIPNGRALKNKHPWDKFCTCNPLFAESRSKETYFSEVLVGYMFVCLVISLNLSQDDVFLSNYKYWT